jgi:hypothetical protein
MNTIYCPICIDKGCDHCDPQKRFREQQPPTPSAGSTGSIADCPSVADLREAIADLVFWLPNMAETEGGVIALHKLMVLARLERGTNHQIIIKQ